MKFLVRVFLCIIVSSVISLLMNDAYGYVQYDYTDGSVVIDFDTNLAGVSSIEGSLIHDAADGYIAPTGNGQSGAVVFSPISPYGSTDWMSAQASIITGNPMDFSLGFLSCAGGSITDSLIAGPFAFDTDMSVNLSGMTQNCLVPVVFMSSTSSGTIPRIDDFRMRWNPLSRHLLSTRPENYSPNACGQTTIDIAHSVSFVEDQFIVVTAQLPSAVSPSLYIPDDDTSFLSASDNGIYTENGTTVTMDDGSVYTIPPHSVYWEIPVMSAGSSNILSFTIQLPCNIENNTRYNMQTTIQGSNSLPVTSFANIYIQSSPSPRIDKSIENDIRIGQDSFFFEPLETQMRYRIRVQNDRNTATEALFFPEVTDDLSLLATNIANVCTGVGLQDRLTVLQGGVFDPTQNTIQWGTSSLGDVIMKGEVVDVEYMIDYTGCTGSGTTNSFLNTATLDATNIDLLSTQHTVHSLDYLHPTGIFSKGVGDPGKLLGEYSYEEVFTYYLNAYNPGLSRIDDVVVMDKLPQGIMLDSPVALPVGVTGSVFYTNQRSGRDPSTPPPYVLTGVGSGTIGSGRTSTFLPDASWIAIYIECIPSSHFPHPDCLSPVSWNIPVRAYMPVPSASMCDSVYRENIGNFTFHAASLSPLNTDASIQAIENPVFVQYQPIRTVFHPIYPELEVTTPIQGPSVIDAGESAVYTIVITNNGQEVSPSTRLEVDIPSFMKNGIASYPTVQVLSGGRGVVEYNLPQSFSIDLDALPIGESRTVKFRLDGFEGVIDGSDFIINASVQAMDTYCGPRTFTTQKHITLQGEPSLFSYKTKDFSYIEQNNEITYTLRTVNRGSAVSEDTYVIDMIPENTEHVATYTQGITVDGDTLNCQDCQVFFAPILTDIPAEISPMNPFDPSVISSYFTPGVQTSPGVRESSFADPHYVAVLIDDGTGVFPVSQQKSFSIRVQDSATPLGGTITNYAAVFSKTNLQSITNQVQTSVFTNPGLIVHTSSNKDVVESCESFAWYVDYYSDAVGINDETTMRIEFPEGVAPQSITHVRNDVALSGGAVPTGDAMLYTGQGYMTGYYTSQGLYYLDIDINAIRGEELTALEGGRLTMNVSVPCDAREHDVFSVDVYGFFANTQFQGSVQDNDPVFVEHADLVLIKNVSRFDPLPGEIVRYTLDISNQGGYDASYVELYDQLPQGACYVTGSATVVNPDWTIGEPIVVPPCSTSTGQLLSRTMSGANTLSGMDGLGRIPAQSDHIYVSYDVRIDENFPYGTTLTNGAWLTTRNNESNLSNNSDFQDIQTPIPDPATTINAPDTVLPGNSFHYTVDYTNRARACSTGTYLLHALPDVLGAGPDGFSDISVDFVRVSTGDIYVWTSTSIGTGNIPAFDIDDPLSGGWISWDSSIQGSIQYIAVDHGRLCDVQGQFSLMVQARAVDPVSGNGLPTGLRLPLFSQIESTSRDSNTTNNISQAEVVVPGIDLEVQARGSPRGSLPGTIPQAEQSYLIEYANRGFQPVCNVYLNVEIASGFVLDASSVTSHMVDLVDDNGLSVSPITPSGSLVNMTDRGIQEIIGSGGQLSFVLGNSPSQLCLPPGSSGEIAIAGSISQESLDGQLVSVDVEIGEHSPDQEFVMTNNYARDTVLVRRADMMVRKSGVSSPFGDDSTSDIRDRITYTVEYNNLGSTVAKNAIVRENIPPGTCIDAQSLVDSLPSSVDIRYFTAGGFAVTNLPSVLSNPCNYRSFEVGFGDLPGPATVVGEQVGNFAGDRSVGVYQDTSGIGLQTYHIEEVPINFSHAGRWEGYESEVFEFNGSVYAILTNFSYGSPTKANVLLERNTSTNQFDQISVSGAQNYITTAVDIAWINSYPVITFSNGFNGRNEFWYWDNINNQFVAGNTVVGSATNRARDVASVLTPSGELYKAFAVRNGGNNELWKWDNTLKSFSVQSRPAGSERLHHLRVDSHSSTIGQFFTFGPACRSDGRPEVRQYDDVSDSFVISTFSGSLPVNTFNTCRSNFVQINNQAYLIWGINGEVKSVYRYDSVSDVFVPVVLGQGSFPIYNETTHVSDVWTSGGRQYITLFHRDANSLNEIWMWNEATQTFDFVQSIGFIGSRNFFEQSWGELNGLGFYTNAERQNGRFIYEIQTYNTEYHSIDTDQYTFSGGGLSTQWNFINHDNTLLGVANNYGSYPKGAVISSVYTGKYRQDLQVNGTGFLGWNELRATTEIPAGDDVLVTFYPDDTYTPGTELLGPVSVADGLVSLHTLPVDTNVGMEITLVSDDLTDAPSLQEWSVSYRSSVHPSFQFDVTVDSGDIETNSIRELVNTARTFTDTPEIRYDNNETETNHVLRTVDLEIEVSVSRTAGRSGDILVYTIDYHNHGPWDADNVDFSTSISNFFVPSSWSVAPDSSIGNVYGRSIGTMPAYSSGQIQFTGTISCSTTCPSEGDLLPNNVLINTTSLERDMDNNEDRALTIIGEYADVYTSIDCGSEFVLGEESACILSYGNQGNIDSMQNTLSLRLDPYLDFVTMTGSDSSGCSYVDNRVRSGEVYVGTGSHGFSCSGSGFSLFTPDYQEVIDVRVRPRAYSRLGADPLTQSGAHRFLVHGDIDTIAPETTTVNNTDTESVDASVSLSTIQGSIYADLSDDESFSPGVDRVLSQVQVCLEGVTSVGDYSVGVTGDIVVPCQRTDSAGVYSFLQIPEGDYTVFYIDSNPYDPLFSSAGYANEAVVGVGSLQGGASQLRIENIVLSSGVQSRAHNFALAPSECTRLIGLVIHSPLSIPYRNQSSVEISGNVLDSGVQVMIEDSVVPVDSSGSFHAYLAVPDGGNVNYRVTASNGIAICEEQVAVSVLAPSARGGGGGRRVDNTLVVQDDCPCGDYSASGTDNSCVSEGEEEVSYRDLYCPVLIEENHEVAPSPNASADIPESPDTSFPFPRSGLPRTGPSPY